MEGMNRVILIGNLGAEPELRHTANGTPFSHVRLATNESFLDKNKEKDERTEWHEIVVWGNRGDALSKLLKKGDCVGVEGGLRTTSWEKDGVKRYKTEVHARDVFLTGGARRSLIPAFEGSPEAARAMRNGKPAPAVEAAADTLPF